MSVQLNSESVPDRQLQPVAATTETATETAPSETAEIPSTGAAPLSEPQRLEAKLEAARSECERLSRVKFDADAAADKRLRQVQSDYGKRVMQLETDLVAERLTNESLSQKIQSLETSLEEQTKGMRRIKQQLSEPEAMLDKTMTELQMLEQKYNALESESAGLRQEREQLQGELGGSQTAQQQAQSQIAELTAKLEQTSRDLANLDKERSASKLSQQKAEELSLQVEKFRNAVEQAELRARESTAQSKDWEKKAADLTKALEDLNRTRVNEQGASAQSTQRLKELEQQLKGANDNLAAGRAETEKQISARQQLETENRKLAEASAKARADLDKEREANHLAQQEAKKLNEQLQKLQRSAEQAEARAGESAGRSQDWEKKAAELKKALDDLNRTRVNEQGASAQSAQRLKELEQQLKVAQDSLAAGKADLEKQTSARQRLELEIRSLTEASAKAKTDLDRERDANKSTRQETEGLNAQLRKLQHAAEQAEARARESAARCGEWEKKAADREKTIGELTRMQTAEQSAGAQSAQRIKELEQQLKLANDALASGKADLEKQNSARQRLEGEIRSLTEANAKAKAEVDRERAASKLSQQKAGELSLQVEKSRNAAEQAELRIRESAAQSKDWEKKAVDLKKALDELNQLRASEQSAGAQSLQRLKELEAQLKSANDHLAASRKETEKRESARQQLETENRKLAEAHAKTRADLDKEHDAHKLSRQAAQELDAELKKAQRVAEQAEARFQKGAALGSEWQEKAAGLKKANSQLDAELVRLRDIEKKAQQEEYMMVDSLRRGLRQQIEELRQSAGGLLEIQLPDKQKRLAETILRNALFLQVFLNSSGKNAGEKFPS